MTLVYRQATRSLECDRCRQKSQPRDIGELESTGWQERGFGYHLCPECVGDRRASTDAMLWQRAERFR
jgi:hypothetical protein